MKVIFTLEDSDDGQVTVGLEFDPPVTKETQSTAAGMIALELMKLVPKVAKGEVRA